MKDKEIYLVLGSCGEYSSYSVWVVAAFSEKDKAEIHAQVCLEKSKQSYKERQDEWTRIRKSGRGPYPSAQHFPEDPEGEVEFDTDYEVVPVRINPDF